MTARILVVKVKVVIKLWSVFFVRFHILQYILFLMHIIFSLSKTLFETFINDLSSSLFLKIDIIVLNIWNSIFLIFKSEAMIKKAIVKKNITDIEYLLSIQGTKLLTKL